MDRQSKNHSPTLKKIIRFLPLLFLLLLACETPTTKPKHAFYHWKTSFAPSPFEEQKLSDLNVDRLYVKYFDVDWPDGQTQANPQAKVSFPQKPEQEVVPTVYLTNQAIQKTGEAHAPQLADKVFKLIFERHPAALRQPTEVQIDCDWTQSTRAAYFAFLERMRSRLDSLDIQLSATIRLHQIKFYKQMGLPPVDRGMLMFYNMGQLDNPDEVNSILDVAEGKRYLANLKSYPLPVDVALPIFAWAVLIRQGKPFKLLNNLRLEDVAHFPWLHSLAPNLMEVDSSHYLESHYLYPTDRIRFEAVSNEALQAAASLLQSKLAKGTRSISFYHLDSTSLQHFSTEELNAVYHQFD